MQCTNCKVKVDADGIIGVHKGDVLTTSRGFAFVLDDSNGLSAHAVRGTHWVDLSWGCAAAVCRAQLNEQGVHVPA